MIWYLKLTIYIISFASASIMMYQIDFNKFMRIGRKDFAVIVWLILSIAVSYLLSSFFIGTGELILNFKNI